MHRSIIEYITQTHTHTHPHLHLHPYPHIHCHSYGTMSNPPLRHAIEYATEPEFGGALLPHQKSTPTTTIPTTQLPISKIWRFRVIFSNAAMRNWFQLWNSLSALPEAEFSNMPQPGWAPNRAQVIQPIRELSHLGRAPNRDGIELRLLGLVSQVRYVKPPEQTSLALQLACLRA